MSLKRRNQVFLSLAVLATTGLAFGFGYFFGRYDQIQLNKSVLKPIPDVNCSQEVH